MKISDQTDSKMVVLTECSLNKRHREFNRKVIEAIEKNVNFDDVKAEGNESDIDSLFKIDLASKYKKIDYILEVLKSGDSLCITRALKSIWMFDMEYSHIINPNFIQEELFPHLSLKSKKKLLTTISIHVRDESRALEYYNFCNSLKYFDIALKFLLFTSEETRLNLLRETSSGIFSLVDNKGLTYIRHFLGNSFALTKIYLEMASENRRRKILYELRYLYSLDNIKYLYLLETYEDPNKQDCYNRFQGFGLRISKDMILKNKDRIYKKPLLYTHIIKKSMFVKYSTIDDAKYYVTALLPCNVNDFWDRNYYESKKHFFDMIPKEEKYQFLKKIFSEKYPDAPFEMTINFYKLQYYDLIVDLELKEEWALRHIKSEKEILGSGRDYLWYRFIQFSKSFDEIKKYIRINKDADVRAQITNVLIESARNDRELETLFKYYYERHINEERFRKERFLDAVDNHHNIFNLDSDCFAALDKIFYSLEVYNVLTTYYCKSEYKIIGLVYRVINNIEMPEALIKFVDDTIPFYILSRYMNKLSKENAPLVFNYLMDFYLNRIKSFDDTTYDESVKITVRKPVNFLLDLMHQFEKPKEEIPEIVMKYVKLDWDEFKYHFYFRTEGVKRLEQSYLLRCLKNDTSEFVSKLPILKKVLTTYPFKVNRVLRKLRLYFSNDIAKEYFKLYEDILNESDVDKHTVDHVVFGIIQMADTKYLEEFMNKYIPTDTKIDHVAIDRKLLSVQRALCSFAGYARPPISLSLILKYIQGDYTQYCLPLFHMYLANLQPAPFSEFVKAIINAPLSIQKHGLRLAFKCFSIDDLKKLVVNVWSQTKNVSLRLIIYKALHDKINENEDNDTVSSLFEVLNRFTSTVYEEDDHELFCLLTSDTLPKSLINEHLKTVWLQFEKLPFRTQFIEYKNNAVRSLTYNLSLIQPKDFIENLVKDHLQYVFEHNHDEERYKMLREGGVIRSKWCLTSKYITFLENNENLEIKLSLTKLITSKCIQNWVMVINGSNIYRNLFYKFLSLLKSQSYKQGLANYRHANILFECILKDVIEGLPIEETYLIIWDLKLNIRTRNVIINANERTNGSEIIKDVGIEFGKVCLALVAEHLEKNMFWIMFENDIRDIISYEANNIATHLKQGDFYNSVHIDDIIVLVCNELTELKQFESYLLAAKMLQTSYDTDVFTIEYNQVLNKLKTFYDPQIKCFVHQRFIRNNMDGSTLM
ncbi:hypothetical protein K1T71_012655 [Dendrolimus kikuchii]|uniref:Uncharacterized protein n=1 Tax=Dendrolimus kikuchii TaxID=765133 RepID=A0ACC1CK96_9NEOP|nr:hypothetical protein K1T71_012655 [Dendrolimus kikuchii]